jgi:uncharacterized protein involved in exopolysaccharide biosynthesis
VAAAAAVIAVVLVPPVYRSHVSFVANSSANKMASMIGGSGALAGLASQFGVQGTGDPSESPQFYIELIGSRELLTRLLQSRFLDPRGSTPQDSATLLDILRIRSGDPRRKLEVAVKRMSRAIRGSYDSKTNLVWFDVDAGWPELSAAVANRTLQLVTTFNREQRVSRIRSKRLFLEGRVDSAEFQLRNAEERQRLFYEENRLWRNSPSLVFAEGQLHREVDIASDLYLTLKHQLEAARIDEFNDAAMITVVDSAVAARKPEWPRYGLLGVSTILFGLLLGTLLAGSLAVYEDWRLRNPARSTALTRALADARRDFRLALSGRHKRVVTQ